jgi:D-alanyl-D-alanine carboxypeptidase
MTYNRGWRVLLLVLVVSQGLIACKGNREPSDGPEPASTTAIPEQSPTTSATATLGAFPPLPEASFPDGVRDSLQSVLDELVLGRTEGGVAAAVVVAGIGSWAGAAGEGDDRGTRLVPQAMFAIASVTKSFIAAEVLHLVEEGRMSLDDPLSTLLPDGLNIDSNEATLRDTLTMRSGISEHVTDDFVADVVAEPGHDWDPERNLDYVGASILPADTRTQYSNTNYILLGFVIEEQTGLSLGEAVDNGVLATRGLRNIVIQDEERPQRPLALPHSGFPGFPSANEAEVVGGGYLPLRSLASAAWSAGGFAADAPTLARWGYLLFGGYVLESASLTEMTTFTEGYGMGAGDLGQGAIGHGGSIPGYSSILMIRPDDGLVVTVLANGEQLDLDLIADRLADVAVDSQG